MNVHLFKVDGITIRGVPTPGPDGRVPSGFYFHVDGVKGFRGGVTVRAHATARTVGDGDFPAPARYSARVSTWKVWTFAHSLQERAELDSLLAGLGGGRAEFTVTAQMDGETLTTLARCGDTPEPVKERLRRPGGVWMSLSEFSLVHADPILYGPEIIAGPGSSIELVHRGAVDAWPVLRVTGTGAGYTVTGGGATFTMATPLPNGHVDVIDSASRTVIRQGSPLASGFTGWVAPVPRRGARTYLVSAGQLRGSVRPTYI